MSSRDDSRPRAVVAVVVFAATFALGFAIVEFASRLLEPSGYRVWPPGFSITFDAGDVIQRGVTFPARLSINEQGMRGGLPDDATRYRILAVGGSTTICVYLDDAQAWPQLLERRLDEALGAGTVWVGNVGRPGHKTDHHLLQVEALLEQHPDIDEVILLLGFNDFTPYLSAVTHPSLAIEPTPRQQLEMAFTSFPGRDDDRPWYLRNFVGRAWTRFRWQPLPGTPQLRPMDEKGEFQARLRGFRQRAGRFVRTLPALDAGLADYRANVRAIVTAARAGGARVLLLTQPTLWGADLTPEEQRLLWAGGPPFYALRDGADYYAAEALAEGMARYNDALLDVCREGAADCLDVARTLPRTTEVFFDDAHFTESGSARLAAAIADHLLARPPLADWLR